ncbi:MAG: dihydropteroate synthase [Myxococcota bacterium]
MGGAMRSTPQKEHGSLRTPSARCSLWGVLNVTPDSFSDGGRFETVERALAHAEAMLAAGADVIDVGGESSRPAGRTYGDGALRVPVEEELRRVVPVVEGLVARGAVVSVDTVKAEVAAAALEAGAHIINDVSGGSESLLEVVAAHDAEVVLMHNRGRGEVAGPNIAYDNVVDEVLEELAYSTQRAISAGVARARIWIDPGIGFAKTAEQSATLLGATERFVATGQRVLVGASRKSFIAALAPCPSGEPPGPQQRLAGSLAAVTLAAVGGAHAIRVHDVAESLQALRVTEASIPASRSGADGEEAA